MLLLFLCIVLYPVSNRTASAEYFVSLQGGGRRRHPRFAGAGSAVASLTDDNAADGKIGGAESVITGRMEQ